MALDPLFGVKAITDVYSPVSNQYSYQSTYAPTTQTTTTLSPQYTIGYNPQIILGSPSASIGGGQMQTPSVTVIPTAQPALSQTSAQTSTQPVTKAGNGNETLIAIAGLGVLGILAYYFIKKKRSVSAIEPRTRTRVKYRSG